MTDAIPKQDGVEPEYRQKAISEYGERCKLCESTRNIVVHHVDGDRANNDLGNLLVVCSPCHADIHSPNRSGSPHDKYTNHLPQSSVYGITGGDQPLKRRSVSIRQDQQDWLESHPINFSDFVRRKLDEYRSGANE